ncbi:hypothetical protein [Pandoravirus japonicus]|uniref:Uncharacterized protein n=1 Tax=Pandoravirus japonicus TaxID=2823154 RepID=A0A811BR69_9VIRU|nr:hypothetical protein [Pandoravirus japonicus]
MPERERPAREIKKKRRVARHKGTRGRSLQSRILLSRGETAGARFGGAHVAVARTGGRRRRGRRPDRGVVGSPLRPLAAFPPSALGSFFFRFFFFRSFRSSFFAWAWATGAGAPLFFLSPL